LFVVIFAIFKKVFSILKFGDVFLEKKDTFVF